VPPWKANIGVQYKFDLGSAGSLTPRVDVNYQDKQYTGPTVIAGERIRNFIPAYTLTNARLTWQNADEDLDVSLEATNVFDKYYLLTIFDLRGAGPCGSPRRAIRWSGRSRSRRSSDGTAGW
jgi:iron complex outermembrane receptor protein